MLVPRRVKHRKQHHPSRSGASKGGTQCAFGDYGIQALEPAYVTNRQIEAARIAMTRHIKRGGKVCLPVFGNRCYDRPCRHLPPMSVPSRKPQRFRFLQRLKFPFY